MNAEVIFTIPGEPAGKGRPRIGRTKGGHAVAFTPAKTASREGMIAHFAAQAMQGRPPIEGAVYVGVLFVVGMPKSMSKRDRAAVAASALLPTKKPDLDNAQKLLFDALNGIVWRDDVQVAECSARKVYGDQPRTEVTIRALAP